MINIMKKEVIVLLLLGILLVSPLVSAQEQSQTYSGFNRFVDNIKLFFSSGDNKVMLALEIREKELNSAINKLKIVQERVSPDTADKVKNNIEMIEKENVGIDLAYFEKYLIEEEKTKLSADLSKKIFDYCNELAMQDYDLMLNDEKCISYSWVEKKVEKNLNQEQEKSQNEIQNQIKICMNNPKECRCDEIPLLSEKKKCERYKSLAIKCEFQDDESACKEINMFKDVQSDKRENYEEEILEKYMPGECLEVGAKDGEECKRLIIALNKPESECIENGQILSGKECERKLVREDKIPGDCIKNGEIVSPEECKEIMKEKSEVSDDEIKVNLQECVDAGYTTKKACEAFILKQNLPKECVDAGALTPEACEKLKLPQKCQGEAFSNEECEAVFIKEKMPLVCQESGTYNFFKCAKLLYARVSDISIEGEIPYLESKGISVDEIPEECFKDSSRNTFERDMDCDEALIKKFGIMLPPPENIENIPEPCIKDGTPVSPEECEEILGSGIIQNELQDVIPEICKEANVETPEECGKLLEEQRIEEGIGINMPEECIGISAEECKKIMEEKNVTIKKPEIEIEEICCKKTIIGEAPRYRWDYEEDCVPSEVQTAEVVSDDFCHKEENINEDIIIKKGVPEECAKLGVYDKESCSLIMSKINEERIKQGDKVVVDDDGNTDVITNDQINQIVGDAVKKSDEIKPDIAKANEIKQEVDVIEDNIKEIDNVAKTIDKKDSDNAVDKPLMDKDNEDVTLGPNIVDDDVAPGPQGIVGEIEVDSESPNEDSGSESPESSSSGESSSGSEGDSSEEGNVITGDVIGLGNKESFLAEFFKRIFGI